MSDLDDGLGEVGGGGNKGLPYGMASAKNVDLENVVWFTLLQNHENKTVEWLITFASEAEKTRWIELVTPPSPSTSNPSEKIYEDWDCPLIEAVAAFPGKAVDEVGLQKGDKANVLRKLSDSGKNSFVNELHHDLDKSINTENKSRSLKNNGDGSECSRL